ncbi:MAG: flagellar motor protein MotB, partial [Alphaproteobacteria bacterium HGW-Alphaproteobacteria-8]
KLMLDFGLAGGRIAEVSGRAATQPMAEDPLDPRNRRVEITLLRGAGAISGAAATVKHPATGGAAAAPAGAKSGAEKAPAGH